MEIFTRMAAKDEIPIVHDVMLQAFEEYRGLLTPPAGALSETVMDIVKKVSKGGGAILAIAGSEVVGSAQFVLHDGFVHIGRVSVLPSFRSNGIGKKLVQFIEAYAKDKGIREARLGVRLSIPSNVAFYTKLNYEVLEKHAYYWYVMNKAV